MTVQGLLRQLQDLGNPRVLVVGDAILDRYIWGIADRVSQEAPVILLREEAREERPGGAANVAAMVAALDAKETTIVGVVGADADGQRLRTILCSRGINAALIDDPSRPTTVKERFVGKAHARHPHQMLRVDREATSPVAAPVEDAIIARVTAEIGRHDVVLLSDYRKGVCTERVVRALVSEGKRRGVPVLIDPGRGVPLEHYRGATLVKPNRTETSNVVGRPIETVSDAAQAARSILEEHRFNYVVITLDRDGLLLAEKQGGTRHYPTQARTVYDITGAGDMVLATLGLCMGASLNVDAAVQVANVAAGLEVEHVGVATISRQQIITALSRHVTPRSHKVVNLEQLLTEVGRRRANGERIVFTNGCFDLVHAGHVRYLQYAAAQGDCLIVAVNSDESVRRLKGPARPILSESDRAELLAALSCVDYVVVFEEDTPHRLLRAIKPDVLIKGGTYSVEGVVGREVVLEYGGTVMVGPVVPGVSTTAIIERILGRKDEDPVRKVA